MTSLVAHIKHTNDVYQDIAVEEDILESGKN